MRNSVQTMRLNEDEIVELSHLMDDYVHGTDPNKILTNCESLLQESSKNDLLDRTSYKDVFGTMNYRGLITDDRESLLTSIFTPAWDCGTLGVSAGFSIGAGPDASMNLGVCTGALGRRVGVIVPAAGFELGIHAGVVLEGQEFKLSDNSEYEGDTNFKLGVGLEVDSTIHGDFEGTGVEGFGVGVGGAAEVLEKGVVIKFIPLSSQRRIDRHMKAELLK